MTSPVAFHVVDGNDDASTPEEEGSAADAPWGVEVDPLSGVVILDPSNRKLITRGIRKRRSVPVCGFVGTNGQGKSFAMVRDSLPTLAAGRPIMSTVTLLDPHTGNPHPLYTQLHSWQQLLDFRDGDLLLDEVTGVADAREQGMPKHIRRHVHQFRHYGVKVRWTGVDFDNTDKRIRQITQAIVRCRGRLPVKAADDDSTAMWAPNRLFVLTTFDAQTLKTADDSALITEEKEKRRRARVLHREYVWGPGSAAFACYDTLAPVSWVDNSCPICGGRPAERTCRGH